MKITTHFGNLLLDQGTDYVDLRVDPENEKSVVIIGLDSNDDGPYWEDESNNWQILNEMCHELFDDNLYRVVEKVEQIYGTLIDNAPIVIDSEVFYVWVTDNTANLFNLIKDFIIQDLLHKANVWLPENVNGFKEELDSVLGFAKESFYKWYDNNLDNIDSAFETVASDRDLEIV